MLAWKPAITKEAVLRMQEAIARYPRDVDYKQCHYYVTENDIAKECGKSPADIRKSDIDRTLGGLGLALDKEVYDFSLNSENTIGFFVPESALLRLSIDIPSWESQASLGSRRGSQKGWSR